jgi:hypothetical protein
MRAKPRTICVCKNCVIAARTEGAIFHSFRASREFSEGSEERLTGGAQKFSSKFFLLRTRQSSEFLELETDLDFVILLCGSGGFESSRSCTSKRRALEVHCDAFAVDMGGIDDHRPGFFSFSSRQRNPRSESVPILVVSFFLHQGTALLE